MADKIVDKPAKDMSDVEQWAVFFNYLTDKTKRDKINEIIACNEGIAMAAEVILTISRDKVERARLESEIKEGKLEIARKLETGDPVSGNC
jgi:hypothetical protein